MTKYALFIIALVGIFFGICSAAPSTSPDDSLFISVVVRDGTVVATLPAVPGLMVTVGAAERRGTKGSEVFTLQPGSSLRLSTRHSSYLVTAQIKPKPGLIVEYTFDGRSFRRELTTKKYFIAAKDPKQSAEQAVPPKEP